MKEEEKRGFTFRTPAEPFELSPSMGKLITRNVLRFEISGDPVPYTRMTQRQVKLMRIPRAMVNDNMLTLYDKISRYFTWKQQAQWIAIEAESKSNLKYPRSPKEKVYLNVEVFFRNKRHADPENIRKGLQDALFIQDKLVAGSIDFGYDSENPRCKIEIRW